MILPTAATSRPCLLLHYGTSLTPLSQIEQTAARSRGGIAPHRRPMRRDEPLECGPARREWAIPSKARAGSHRAGQVSAALTEISRNDRVWSCAATSGERIARAIIVDRGSLDHDGG